MRIIITQENNFKELSIFKSITMIGPSFGTGKFPSILKKPNVIDLEYRQRRKKGVP